MTDIYVPIALIVLGPAGGVIVSLLAAQTCREEHGHCDEMAGMANERPTTSDGSETLPSSSSLVAAATALALSALAVFAGQSDPERVLGTLFLILLLGLFLADRTCLRLPDIMTAPLFAIGLGLGTLNEGLWSSLVAATIGAGSLWAVATIYELLRRRQGLGFGDVKMMAGVSAALGSAAIPWVILFSALLGLGAAMRIGKATFQTSGELVVPFGCPLAVASGAIWLLT